MDLLFLGTSAGQPTKTRNVTGIAVIETSGRHWYLVDCGEGTQQQLLRTPLSLTQLNAIFITHVHGDHCFGLPGILASAAMNGRKTPLTIVAPRDVIRWVTDTQRMTQLKLPYEINPIECESLPVWTHGSLSVDVFPLSHRVPSHAYRFTNQAEHLALDTEKLQAHNIPQGQLWGALKKGQDVDHNGITLQHAAYTTSVTTRHAIIVAGDNEQPDLLTTACQQAQVLVHEATFTQATLAKQSPVAQTYGHSTAEGIAKFAQSVALPNLVLTHFSPRYQEQQHSHPNSVEAIRNEAQQHYQGQLFLAKDFSRFHLNKAGVLQLLN